IPLGTYDRFVAALQASQPQGMGEETVYIVKSGDTLSKIASNYRGVSVAEIQTNNGISGSRLSIGQKLRIPGPRSGTTITLASTARESVTYDKLEARPIKLEDGFQLVQQSGSRPGKPLLAVRLTAIDEDEGVMSLVPTIYKVRSGDTLGSIAQRFSVSVASIREGNRLSGSTIRPNQELTIHSATSTRLDAAAAPIATAQQSLRSYKVRSGDNLYDIARQFGVSLDALRQRNNLSSDLLRIGQTLRID
ncbi:MAG: LysM peptidoglycan-binding domain-containing protein, partial [Pseudomonadales bacterium]|nr:LysM peptidoglycan-binding domain-containing protein [Pseudomonadales bacterium]